MPFTILMLGDIVGRPGRVAVCRLLPKLVAERRIDFVVADSENISEGSGITPPLFDKLVEAGIDVCTMGDHAFRRRESRPIYERSDRLLRPANLPAGAVGKGVTVVRSRSGVPVAVAVLLGQLQMKNIVDNPFAAADRLLAGLPAEPVIRLVEFHAEITAEKVAFGRHLAGRVTAVVGTHTHVATADEQILAGGTAYVTDLGMSGPHDGVLGRSAEAVLKSLTTGMPEPYDVSEGDPRITGVIITADPATGRALTIERIQIRDDEPAPAGESGPGRSNAGAARPNGGSAGRFAGTAAASAPPGRSPR